MNILEKIVAQKKLEVAERWSQVPVKQLEQSVYFSAPTQSLKKSLQDKNKSVIITEFKRQSPSKGIIHAQATVETVTSGYVQAGASALSILTDSNFFGGSNADLLTARKLNFCPILRKDFTIDEYQLIEAKAIGADAILLIAAILQPKQIILLSDFAHSLGLEVLLEVHSHQELDPSFFSHVDLIGVNNRDLKTFEVNTDLSKKLSSFIPSEIIKISESGISKPETIVELKKYGFEGFLIGENFMKESRPEVAAAEFITKLKSLS